MKIFLTGATGYVGGRLIPRLLEAGHKVRVITRDARHVSGRSWLEQVEVVEQGVQVVEGLPHGVLFRKRKRFVV